MNLKRAINVCWDHRNMIEIKFGKNDLVAEALSIVLNAAELPLLTFVEKEVPSRLRFILHVDPDTVPEETMQKMVGEVHRVIDDLINYEDVHRILRRELENAGIPFEEA